MPAEWFILPVTTVPDPDGAPERVPQYATPADPVAVAAVEHADGRYIARVYAEQAVLDAIAQDVDQDEDADGPLGSDAVATAINEALDKDWDAQAVRQRVFIGGPED